MKERPILFSGSMVRAILEGRKTQTRRILKTDSRRKDGAKLVPELLQSIGVGYACPHGAVGDRLWVKETFLLANGGVSLYCRADQEEVEAAGFGAMYGGWKPSIFMPRKWSRITLAITNVRVERLNDISEDDAWAEGVKCEDQDCGSSEMNRNRYYPTNAYRRIWESINGAGSWLKNPWVWVIEFKHV